MTTAARVAKDAPFEPELVAFCCNWCGYAGADFAGVARIQYPPNIRILRLMCSGRVDPGHILKALRMGADGVLVVGCHPGDCHYMSGNNHAVEVVDTTKELMRTLGLDGRLRLEWISAAEGVRFGHVVSEFTSQLKALGPSPLKGAPMVAPSREAGARVEAMRARLGAMVERTGVYNCLECAKCASSCPITRLNPSYSPMLTVERALRSMAEEITDDMGAWTCMTCGTCHERCPSDVDYLGFVRALRAIGPPERSECSHGGVFSTVSLMHASGTLRQQGRLSWVSDGLKVASKGEVLYFTGCAPYQEPVFKGIGASPLEIARSTVHVLNAAGIVPAVLEDERCCGHDMLWSGDGEGRAAELARLNAKAIAATGAKRVVFSCPEGYSTFAKDYPALLGDDGLDVRLMHTTELFAELIDEGHIRFDATAPGGGVTTVTYQDPCRLGRYMGVYEAPRKVLSSIPGVELREMPCSRSNSICCGVSAWLNCGTFSKRIQVDRLREAAATGARTLVTACPKCNVHFNCVMSEPENPSLPSRPDIVVRDISVLVAGALGRKGVSS